MPELSALSDTGPLISIFQSDSLKLVLQLFDRIHTSLACLRELDSQGWSHMVEQAGPALIGHALTELEAEEAQAITRRVAQHALSRDPEPEHHIGEAEVIVLARRPEFIDSVLLLDERAARAIAEEENLTISGFAGVLLLAVEERYLTAEEVKAILERCRAQGTHYSAAFVERMVQAAKEREG